MRTQLAEPDDPPAAFECPERANLAHAISRFNDAEAYLGKVEDTISRKSDAIFDLIRAIEKAEEAAADARRSEPRRLVAALLDDGGGSPPGDVPSLATAEALVAKLNSEAAGVRRDRDLLTPEKQRAETTLAIARAARNDAVQAVVRADGKLTEIQDEYDAARMKVASLAAALGVVSLSLPRDFRGKAILDRPLPQTDASFAEQWKQAIAALETDANAQLPRLADD